MTIAASSLLRRVIDQLQDETGIQWTTAELVRYLNDGQREILVHRPDALDTEITHILVAGERQTLPANGTKLIDIRRNTSGAKRAITQVPAGQLDQINPGWQGMTGVTEILHFIYDIRKPRTFYVYPPAASTGASVELSYSAKPTDVAEPVAGALYDAVVGNIGVPDEYANPLQDYIAYRCYMKDSEYAGNEAKATNRYTMFAATLGVDIKGTLAISPSGRPGNPNMAKKTA